MSINWDYSKQLLIMVFVMNLNTLDCFSRSIFGKLAGT